MSKRKDSEDYLRQLEDKGYKVEQARRSSHWHIRWDGRLVTTASGTPSGGRELVSLKARIRKFERERAGAPGRPCPRKNPGKAAHRR